MMEWLERRLSSPRAISWTVAAAVVLTLPTLTLGFMLDDYSQRLMVDRRFAFPGGHRALWDFFRFQDGDRATFRGLLEAGVAPWWTAPDFRLAFFRPLTSLLHAADYTLFPTVPALMHAENVALYAAIVAIVARLYRRILDPLWVAVAAALMFAIDDAHAIVVAWIANRNALLAVVFGFGALLAHVRSRTEEGRGSSLFASVLFTLALLSGEASLAVLVYILAYALCLDEGPRRRRALSLVPYACITAAWFVSYRWIGYGSRGGGFYVDPLREPTLYALAVLERAPVLLLAQFGFPPSDLWLAVPARLLLACSIVVDAIVIAGGILVWKVVRRERQARFFATGTALSILPLCATWPNDRLLLSVGFGAFGLVALFLARVRELSGPLRLVAKPLAVAFVLLHVVLAPLLLVFREVAANAMFKRPVARAAASLPIVDGSDRQTFVILNAPNALVPLFAVTERVVESGTHGPARVRLLGVTLAGTLVVERIDDRSLALVFSEGFPHDPLSRFFRGPQTPFEIGREIDVGGLAVRVDSCKGDGSAERVVYRFDEPLEDSKLVWLVWERTGFVSYRPPSIGSSETRSAIAWMDAAD